VTRQVMPAPPGDQPAACPAAAAPPGGTGCGGLSSAAGARQAWAEPQLATFDDRDWPLAGAEAGCTVQARKAGR
jgi:hypothetical protein